MASRSPIGWSHHGDDEAYSQSQEPISTAYHSKPLSSCPKPAVERMQQIVDNELCHGAIEQSLVTVSPLHTLAPTLNNEEPLQHLRPASIDQDYKTNGDDTLESIVVGGSRILSQIKSIILKPSYPPQDTQITVSARKQPFSKTDYNPVKSILNLGSVQAFEEKTLQETEQTLQLHSTKKTFTKAELVDERDMSMMHLHREALELEEANNSNSNLVSSKINLAVTPPPPGAQIVSARQNRPKNNDLHSRYELKKQQASNGYTFHTVVQSQGEGSPVVMPANDSNRLSISSQEEKMVKPPRVYQVVESRQNGHPMELVSLKSSDNAEDMTALISKQEDLMHVENSQEAQCAAMYITERSNEERYSNEISPMKETKFPTSIPNSYRYGFNVEQIGSAKQSARGQSRIHKTLQKVQGSAGGVAGSRGGSDLFRADMSLIKFVGEQNNTSKMMAPQRKQSKIKRTMTAKYKKYRKGAAKIKKAINGRTNYKTIDQTSAEKSECRSQEELVFDEEARLDKIRGNLQLINQIMQLQSEKQPEYTSIYGHSRANSCYLPLPNHNYQQGGKLQASAIPAKASLYQIRSNAKFQHVRSATYHASLARTLSTQSEDERQKKISINKKTLGQRMHKDYSKMAQAQQSMAKYCEKAHYISYPKQPEKGGESAMDKSLEEPVGTEVMIKEDHSTSEIDRYVVTKSEGRSLDRVSTRRRPVRSGCAARMVNATTETLKGAVDLEEHSNKLMHTTNQTVYQSRVVSSALGRSDYDQRLDSSAEDQGKFQMMGGEASRSRQRSRQSSKEMQAVGSSQAPQHHVINVVQGTDADQTGALEKRGIQLFMKATSLELHKQDTNLIQTIVVEPAQIIEEQLLAEGPNVDQELEEKATRKALQSTNDAKGQPIQAEKSGEVYQKVTEQSAAGAGAHSQPVTSQQLLETQKSELGGMAGVQKAAPPTILDKRQEKRQLKQVEVSKQKQKQHEQQHHVMMTFSYEKLNTDIAHIKVQDSQYRQLAESSIDSLMQSVPEQTTRNHEKLGLSKDSRDQAGTLILGQNVFKLEEDFTIQTEDKLNEQRHILSMNESPLVRAALKVKQGDAVRRSKENIHQQMQTYTAPQLNSNQVDAPSGSTDALNGNKDGRLYASPSDFGGQKSTVNLNESSIFQRADSKEHQGSKSIKEVQKFENGQQRLERNEQMDQSVSHSSTQMTDQQALIQPQFQSRNNTVGSSMDNQLAPPEANAFGKPSQGQITKGKSGAMIIDVRVSSDGVESHPQINEQHESSQRNLVRKRGIDRVLMDKQQFNTLEKDRKNTNRIGFDSRRDERLDSKQSHSSRQYQTAMIGMKDSLLQGKVTSLADGPPKSAYLIHRSSKRGKSLGQVCLPQQTQQVVAKDSYSCFSKGNLPEQQFGALEGCLDVRSSNKSVSNRQLFSNAKIPVIKPWADGMSNRFHKRLDHKKQEKSKKVFTLHFNDISSQQRNVGRGMQILGKNYLQPSSSSIPLHVQQIQMALNLKREQQTRTADIIKHNARHSQINYNYISDASQIQLLQQQQQQQQPMLVTLPAATNKKPTTASQAVMNPRQLAKLHGSLIDQNAQILIQSSNTVNNWASQMSSEAGDQAQLRTSQQTQLRSQLQTQPSMCSYEIQRQRPTTLAHKDISFTKNKMLQRSKAVRVGGSSHGQSQHTNLREKPYLDQQFILSSKEAVGKHNALYQSTEKIGSDKQLRKKKAPDSRCWSKPDLALCSTKKPGSAVSVVTNSTSVGHSVLFVSKEAIRGAQLGYGGAKDILDSPDKSKKSQAMNINSTWKERETVAQTLQGSLIAQDASSFTQRLSNFQLLYSQPYQGSDQSGTLPGKRILTKAQPSVFSTIMSSMVEDNQIKKATKKSNHAQHASLTSKSLPQFEELL